MVDTIEYDVTPEIAEQAAKALYWRLKDKIVLSIVGFIATLILWGGFSLLSMVNQFGTVGTVIHLLFALLVGFYLAILVLMRLTYVHTLRNARTLHNLVDAATLRVEIDDETIMLESGMNRRVYAWSKITASPETAEFIMLIAHTQPLIALVKSHFTDAQLHRIRTRVASTPR